MGGEMAGGGDREEGQVEKIADRPGETLARDGMCLVLIVAIAPLFHT